ncbi:hypothetical protein JCM8097_004559 [Rhodosporidiobolus ruineniae]
MKDHLRVVELRPGKPRKPHRQHRKSRSTGDLRESDAPLEARWTPAPSTPLVEPTVPQLLLEALPVDERRSSSADSNSISDTSSTSSASTSSTLSPSLADRFPGLHFSVGANSVLFSFDWAGGIEGAYKVLGIDRDTKDKRLLFIFKKIVEEELTPPTVNEHVCTAPRRQPSTRLGAVLIIACSRTENASNEDTSTWFILLRNLYTYEMTAALQLLALPLPRAPTQIHLSGHKHSHTLQLNPIILDWVYRDERDGVVPGTYLAGNPVVVNTEEVLGVLESADPSFMVKALLPFFEASGASFPSELRNAPPDVLMKFFKESAKFGTGKTTSSTAMWAAFEAAKKASKPSSAIRHQGEKAVESTATELRLMKELEDIRAQTDGLTAQFEVVKREGFLHLPRHLLPTFDLPEDFVKLANYDAVVAENVELRAQLASMPPTVSSSTNSCAVPPVHASAACKDYVLHRLAERLKEANGRLRAKSEENLSLMLDLSAASTYAPLAPIDEETSSSLITSASSAIQT